jgi:SsrA-binding protein
MSKQSNSINRKARFNFHIHDEFVAGMVLLGSEVKSIKGGHASIGEAFCFLRAGEVFLKNAHIKEYANGGFINHDPKRERKLLLTQTEIKKITKALDQKGLTLVPLEIYTNRELARLRKK